MTCKKGAFHMQNGCIFLTEVERKIVDCLKEYPKPYSELCKEIKGACNIKDKRTINDYLNQLEKRNIIFRVNLDGKIFFRLNTFPEKINSFLQLAKSLRLPQLQQIREEILRVYPNIPFERIIENWIKHIQITDPENKGLIELLKMFKNGYLRPLRYL